MLVAGPADAVPGSFVTGCAFLVCGRLLSSVVFDLFLLSAFSLRGRCGAHPLEAGLMLFSGAVSLAAVLVGGSLVV